MESGHWPRSVVCGSSLRLTPLYNPAQESPFGLAGKLKVTIRNTLENGAAAILGRRRRRLTNRSRRHCGPTARAPVAHGASEAILPVFLDVGAVNDMRPVRAVLDIGSGSIDGDYRRLAVIIKLPGRIQQRHGRGRSNVHRGIGISR